MLYQKFHMKSLSKYHLKHNIYDNVLPIKLQVQNNTFVFSQNKMFVSEKESSIRPFLLDVCELQLFKIEFSFLAGKMNTSPRNIGVFNSCHQCDHKQIYQTKYIKSIIYFLSILRRIEMSHYIRSAIGRRTIRFLNLWKF